MVGMLGGLRLFQPTRPYGARRMAVIAVWMYGIRFQPTRPYGARRSGKPPSSRVRDLTPRPLWGGAVSARWGLRAAKNFTPRPLLGRDSGRSVHLLPLLISTHAPLWGATVGVNHCRLAAVFQPTRPYGARQASRRGERSGRDFNPRAPMGRDWQFMQDSAFFTYSIHFSRCVAPCATSKLSLWACHSARTS